MKEALQGKDGRIDGWDISLTSALNCGAADVTEVDIDGRYEKAVREE